MWLLKKNQTKKLRKKKIKMRPITTICCKIFENSISSLEREDFLHKETEHHK